MSIKSSELQVHLGILDVDDVEQLAAIRDDLVLGKQHRDSEQAPNGNEEDGWATVVHATHSLSDVSWRGKIDPGEAPALNGLYQSGILYFRSKDF
jgi:hypothetical protein